MKEQEFSPFEYDWKWDDTKQVLRVTERKSSAAKWVAEVLEHCNCDREICISSVGRYVYVCDNAGQMAKACCATTDTFNKNTGMRLPMQDCGTSPFIPHSSRKPLPNRRSFPLKMTARLNGVCAYTVLRPSNGGR